MTNKQKYKRLSWLLTAGTMILFAGGLTIPNIDYYVKNHEWFLWVYFLSIGAMAFAALYMVSKYEGKLREELNAKNKQELESFQKEIEELSDAELIKQHIDTPYHYDKFKILAKEICYRWEKTLDKTSA